MIAAPEQAAPATVAPARSAVPALLRWIWLLPGLLALIAYAPVLRIGFLSDDIVLLAQSPGFGLDAATLLPDPIAVFWRPFARLVTWRLGWELFHTNAVPFHLELLIIHAVTATLLGLWVREVSGKRNLGLIAGALFAVFPLHMEAVGWLAAAYDTWAVFFGIASLLLFTRWWRLGGGRRTYAVTLLLWALGLYSKESLLTFIPLFVLAPLLLERGRLLTHWRRLLGGMSGLLVVYGVYLLVRLIAWGNIGGYQRPFDYANAGWDGLLALLRVLIAPINSAALGQPVVQIVGLVVCAALLAGLIFFGRRWRLLLAVMAIWVLLALAPVLYLGVSSIDLQGNRFMYLAAAGYCIFVAALLYEALRALRWRVLGGALLLLLLVGSTVTCWLQLRPWHTATVINHDIEEELMRLIPPQASTQGAIWYVQNTPDSYEGAYLLRLGLGGYRYFATDLKIGGPVVLAVPEASKAGLSTTSLDAYAINFAYDAAAERYHVASAAGISMAQPAPSGPLATPGMLLWDFGNCDPAAVEAWQSQGADRSCVAGSGLQVQARSDDPLLEGPDIDLHPAADDRFVRVRVSISYPQNRAATGMILQGFWLAPGDSGWSAEKSWTTLIKPTPGGSVYWTFLPADKVRDGMTRLRLDPVNGQLDSIVNWIAVDLVK